MGDDVGVDTGRFHFRLQHILLPGPPCRVLGFGDAAQLDQQIPVSVFDLQGAVDIGPFREQTLGSRHQGQPTVRQGLFLTLGPGAGRVLPQAEFAGPGKALAQLHPFLEATRTAGGLRRSGIGQHGVVQGAGGGDAVVSRLGGGGQRLKTGIAGQYGGHQLFGGQRLYTLQVILQGVTVWLLRRHSENRQWCNEHHQGQQAANSVAHGGSPPSA